MALEFEWDDDKAGSNIRKHGLTFEFGKLIFQDFYSLEVPDDVSDPNEIRWIRLGLIFDKEFVVTYTQRGQVIRLISVRKAEKHERAEYWKDR